MAFLPESGHAASLSPESFVRNFYKWFFDADAKAPANLNDEIFTYLSPEIVKKIRANPSDEYYVTKANSWTADWTKIRVAVHKAIKMANGVAVVPVTFYTEATEYHVVVFVAWKNNDMRIIKIIDIYPYS